MFKYFAIAAFMLLGFGISEAQAQYPRNYQLYPYGYNYGYGYGYGHSSTAAEGYLRGYGAAWSGYGNYLQSRGAYEIYHEQARQQYIQNWQSYVETRRRLQDEYKARKAAEYAAQRAKREAYLAKKKKSPLSSKIGWNGRFYGSIEELRLDPDYQRFLAEKR